jgi:hypothetical protein
MSGEGADHRPAVQWGVEPEAVYKETAPSGRRILAKLIHARLAFLAAAPPWNIRPQ